MTSCNNDSLMHTQTFPIGLPFGQVPVLRITPECSICQTGAIEYYVAKKHGQLYNL